MVFEGACNELSLLSQHSPGGGGEGYALFMHILPSFVKNEDVNVHENS